MIYEVWRSDDSGTIIEAGNASTRAMEMQEPNARLVRRIEAASWDSLKPRIDEEMHAVRPDDLNIPAREFQISSYSNGVRVGDVFEVKKQYRIEIPGGGSVPSGKVGTRYRVVEGDIQAPDLIVMRCMSDEWSQFHLIRADSHDWTNYEKKE
jgi:hypothetical protein